MPVVLISTLLVVDGKVDDWTMCVEPYPYLDDLERHVKR